MFDYPLLEVVQAIEHLRKFRGTTNKQVCDFVRNRGKNPNDPMKVLKTVRCLNKLVEEGVLCKKGRRYLFPSKCEENSKSDEEEQDCEEDDEYDDDDDEDDDDDDDDDDDEECDDDDEECDDEDDDDDDDDEEEEDDDDDDDDDEECDEKDAPVRETASQNKEPCSGDSGVEKMVSKNKSQLGSGTSSSNNVSGKPSANNDNGINNNLNGKCGKKNGSGRNGKKQAKGKCSSVAKNSCGKKGGEPIAFCARDLLDSQYHPSEVTVDDKAVKLQEKQRDVRHIIQNLEVGKIFSGRRRDSKGKRSCVNSSSAYRSRSPVRGNKAALYEGLKLDEFEDMGPEAINSQLFQEPTDADMDVDLEKDGDTNDTYYELVRPPSSIVAPEPSAPGGLGNIKESSCSDCDNKIHKGIKLEPGFECEKAYSLKKALDSRHSMIKAKENHSRRFHKDSGDRNKDKYKRDFSGNAEKLDNDDDRLSLCSVCEKKKRNS